jgi:hypothetical protein
MIAMILSTPYQLNIYDRYKYLQPYYGPRVPVTRLRPLRLLFHDNGMQNAARRD